jgi:hypothetical protein
MKAALSVLCLVAALGLGLLLTASCTTAQPPQPPPAPVKPIDIRNYQDAYRSYAMDRDRQQFVQWAVIASLATIADVESTFHALERCGESCREGNPLMRATVDNGRAVTYAIQGSVTAWQLYRARKLQREGFRRWYLVPLIHTAGHGLAAGWNLRLVW